MFARYYYYYYCSLVILGCMPPVPFDSEYLVKCKLTTNCCLHVSKFNVLFVSFGSTLKSRTHTFKIILQPDRDLSFTPRIWQIVLFSLLNCFNGFQLLQRLSTTLKWLNYVYKRNVMNVIASLLKLKQFYYIDPVYEHGMDFCPFIQAHFYEYVIIIQLASRSWIHWISILVEWFNLLVARLFPPIFLLSTVSLFSNTWNIAMKSGQINANDAQTQTNKTLVIGYPWLFFLLQIIYY